MGNIDYYEEILVQADGNFYIVVTGYNESNPKHYMIYKQGILFFSNINLKKTYEKHKDKQCFGTILSSQARKICMVVNYIICSLKFYWLVDIDIKCRICSKFFGNVKFKKISPIQLMVATPITLYITVIIILINDCFLF